MLFLGLFSFPGVDKRKMIEMVNTCTRNKYRTISERDGGVGNDFISVSLGVLRTVLLCFCQFMLDDIKKAFQEGENYLRFCYSIVL